MPIVYGPPPGAELARAAERGEVAFGGCNIDQPQRWACGECDYRWPLPSEAFESPLVASALDLAYEAHAGQVRKGDDTPYVDHPIEVAHMLYEEGFDETVVAAGLLHDVVEDSEVTVAQLADRFGADVAALVDVLTDDRSLPYNERKEQHRRKVRQAGMPAAAIYAADKLANLRAFRAAYRTEGEALSKRFNASIDVMLLRWREDLDMLGQVDPQPPFQRELEDELEGLDRNRTRPLDDCSRWM
jgi:hypothetical protein